MNEFPLEDPTSALLAAETVEEVEAALADLIDEATEFSGVQTFEQAGVMTYNSGLVVRIPAGEFQLTIVRSA